MTKREDSAQTIALDRLLAFTLPDRNARGRVVRLGPVLEEILAAHNYAAAIKHLLAEALTLTALIGGLLKSDGSQLTMQAQTEGGVVELLVCDFRDGELRGYVKHDAGRLASAGAEPSLAALFGAGALVITFEVPSTRQRYQGIVPLQGESLAEAVEAYFAQSEQVPTLIRTAIRIEGGECAAGGLLLQYLAEAEEGGSRLHARRPGHDWEHVEILAQSVRADELIAPGLSSRDLVWRLFHEESQIRAHPPKPLSRGCRCSVLHFEEILARFPKDERRAMHDENGVIRVDCAFCSREFPIQD